MNKLQELKKKLHITQIEIGKLQDQQRNVNLKLQYLNEQVWRLTGEIESEIDENEYQDL